MKVVKIDRNLAVAIIAGLGFIGITFFTLPMYLEQAARARARLKWPSVQAKVESSRCRGFSTKIGERFAIDLDYSYVVASTRYSGSAPAYRISDSASFPQPRIGSEIVVWYDPKRSSENAPSIVNTTIVDYLGCCSAAIIAIGSGWVAYFMGGRVWRSRKQVIA